MKKLVLKKAIQLGEQGATVTELNFREEICAGDLRGVKFSALQDPSPEDYLKIASKLCGQHTELLNNLGMADMTEVCKTIDGFIKAGQMIGTAP